MPTKRKHLTVRGAAIVTIGCCCLMAASSAKAYEATTGKWLWVDCFTAWGVSTYYQHFASCRGFITAIADTMQAGAAIDGRRACIPEATTRNEMLNAVTAWLEQHPERRAHPAAQSVVMALSDLYKCKAG